PADSSRPGRSDPPQAPSASAGAAVSPRWRLGLVGGPEGETTQARSASDGAPRPRAGTWGLCPRERTMFRMSLPDSDTVLLFTPPWAELGPVLQATLLALLCLVPLGLVVWLYRYEMLLVKRGVARALLGLRLVALLVLLTLVCLQPVYARTSRETLPG